MGTKVEAEGGGVGKAVANTVTLVTRGTSQKNITPSQKLSPLSLLIYSAVMHGVMCGIITHDPIPFQ